MEKRKFILAGVLSAAMLVASGSVVAGNCGVPGQQDSTCGSIILSAAIPPPTCGSGYTQTNAPTWNGVQWVGLSCQAVTPPASVPPNKELFAFQEAGGSLGAEIVYVMADGSGQNVYLLYGITPLGTTFSPSNLTSARTTGPFPITTPFSTTIAALWGTCQVGVNAPIHCGYYNMSCATSGNIYSCTFKGQENAWATYGGGVPYTPTVTDPYISQKAWNSYYISMGFPPLPTPDWYTGWGTSTTGCNGGASLFGNPCSSVTETTYLQ